MHWSEQYRFHSVNLTNKHSNTNAVGANPRIRPCFETNKNPNKSHKYLIRTTQCIFVGQMPLPCDGEPRADTWIRTLHLNTPSENLSYKTFWPLLPLWTPVKSSFLSSNWGNWLNQVIDWMIDSWEEESIAFVKRYERRFEMKQS